MANWQNGQLTKAGSDLQIKVEAGRCKLELTKIKLGDGTEDISTIDTLTDLVGPKAVFGISSVVAKDGMCTVTGVISSSNVTAAFYAREWGLFAKDPDIGEILYMISLDPNPESIPPKTAALKQAATFAMNIVVSNAANIEARIDPAGLVNASMLANGAGLVQRSTKYERGDILYDMQLARHDLRLECTQTGTTAAALQDLSGVHLGQSITDGTAVWRVKRLYTVDDGVFESSEDGYVMPTCVPRANNDGSSIGSAQKHWGVGYFGVVDTCMRKHAYLVGDIAYSARLPSWARLECVKAGTTAADEPAAFAQMSSGGVLITDGDVLWIVDDVRDGTPVGAVRGSLYLPTGYVKANGATVQRADYPRFIALADKHNLWTDDTTANAGLFGRGDGAATMVLPNWTDRMVQLAGDGAGATVAAGLPNITGTTKMGFILGNLSGVVPTGVGAVTVKTVDSLSNYDAGRATRSTVGIDASKSNPIYGASSTVQPPAIKLIPIIRY